MSNNFLLALISPAVFLALMVVRGKQFETLDFIVAIVIYVFAVGWMYWMDSLFQG